jgi:UDP-3-O-acyl N-acetylglucosamine deacetylase
VNAPSRPQRTIGRAVETAGAGLHTGRPARLRCTPLEAGAGLVFLRSDLGPNALIPSQVAYRADHPRRTTLSHQGAEVHTVEHLLSALYVLGIDNALLDLDGPEAPGLDGSSLPFLALLESAGVREQERSVDIVVVRRPFEASAGGAEIRATPRDAPGLSLEYHLDYPIPGLSELRLSLEVNLESYRREVAPARTFCLKAEAEALRAAGLGLGATFDNTVVWGEDGPIGTELRFADEPLRHKVLDLIGDLSLIGRPLQAHVVATKSGHALNAELARQILANDGGL